MQTPKAIALRLANAYRVILACDLGYAILVKTHKSTIFPMSWNHHI